MQQYSTSKHLDDALLRLAQLEISRGDRAAAIQNLTRLAEHTPAPVDRTRAVILASQARLDSGDTTSACQSISPDLASTVAADSALAQQLTGVSSVCAARNSLTSNGATIADSTVRSASSRDSVEQAGDQAQRHAGRHSSRADDHAMSLINDALKEAQRERSGRGGSKNVAPLVENIFPYPEARSSSAATAAPPRRGIGRRGSSHRCDRLVRAKSNA